MCLNFQIFTHLFQVNLLQSVMSNPYNIVYSQDNGAQQISWNSLGKVVLISTKTVRQFEDQLQLLLQLQKQPFDSVKYETGNENA